MFPLSADPSSNVTVWAVVSLFVHVTLLPVGTEVVAGLKAKSLIVTAVAPPAGAAGAWLPAAGDAAEPEEPEQAATAINVRTLNMAVVRLRVIGSLLANPSDARRGSDRSAAIFQRGVVFSKPTLAPCGSLTIANRPPGKSCGPCSSRAPASIAFLNAPSTSSTAK